jgi:hypothetical protein
LNQKRSGICLTFFIDIELHTLIAVFGTVAGASLEEIIVGLDIRGKVNGFTSGKLPCGFKDNLLAFMIGAFKVTSESDLANILAAFGSVCGWDFIFGINGGKRTFRYACAAINAGVGVDVHPGPFGYRLTGDNAFHGTYFNTTAVTNA